MDIIKNFDFQGNVTNLWNLISYKVERKFGDDTPWRVTKQF
jgi:hypothetical protein